MRFRRMCMIPCSSQFRHESLKGEQHGIRFTKHSLRLAASGANCNALVYLQGNSSLETIFVFSLCLWDFRWSSQWFRQVSQFSETSQKKNTQNTQTGQTKTHQINTRLRLQWDSFSEACLLLSGSLPAGSSLCVLDVCVWFRAVPSFDVRAWMGNSTEFDSQNNHYD